VPRQARRLPWPTVKAWRGSRSSRVIVAPLAPGVGPTGLYPQARIALWLGGVALVVFLIAVANVTNLLLQRAAQRQQEIAVRLALGMGRLRLARQWITESLLMALLGGVLGLLVSRWGGELIRLALLPGMAPSEGLADWPVLMVTGATVLAAGILTGLLPALQAISPSLGVLKGGRQAQTFRRSPLRTGLLLAQTALSTVLLLGSGLFVSSFQKVRSQDFGFSTQRTLLATLQFDANVPAARQDALYREALARLKILPGVEEAIPTDALPFGPTSAPAVDVPGVNLTSFQQTPFMNAAAPEYFKVLGMRLLRGRGITLADTPAAAPVVVVSETMARSLWPGGDAIGKCVRFGFVADPTELATAPCREVVGIVNDARPRSIRPEPQPVMQFYVPYEQVPASAMPGSPTISGLLIRTTGDPERLAGPVQRVLQSFAPDLPYANVRPYQALIDPQMGTWRLGAVLFSVFGGLALALAAIGLYAVLSYMVAQRSKEMGIRMALGAQPGNVIRLVVGEGLWFAGLGILAGGAAALAAGSWLEPLLFETRPWEPAVLGGVALTLGLVALLASLLPAWRATRTDPNLVLKME
jgi:putative ABC transport system permease protein